MAFLIFDNMLCRTYLRTLSEIAKMQSRMADGSQGGLSVVVNRSSADGRVTGCYDVCVTSRQAEGAKDRNQTNEELEIKMKRTKA